MEAPLLLRHDALPTTKGLTFMLRSRVEVSVARIIRPLVHIRQARSTGYIGES